MLERSLGRSLEGMPEAFVSDKSITRAVSRAAYENASAGKPRTRAPRPYTCNMADAPDVHAARNPWTVGGDYFAGAIIANRVAPPRVCSRICDVRRGSQNLHHHTGCN